MGKPETQATIHLIKLCVGVAEPEELEAWQAKRRRETGQTHAFHVTRMWPRRDQELIANGSLYWVMKGEIRARQRILALKRVEGEDATPRCAIILDNDVVRVERAVRRAFQGWRYLEPNQAPRDLVSGGSDDGTIPVTLASALAEVGVR